MAQSKLAKPKTGTKMAFIISQPAGLPAREVVARAKARGISTTVQAVHVCRTHARSRGLLPALGNGKSNGHAVTAKPKPAHAGPAVKKVPATADAALTRDPINGMLARTSVFSDAEKTLLELAVRVGVPRAAKLIAALQTSLAETMSRVISEFS